jgi:hypothetical protein
MDNWRQIKQFVEVQRNNIVTFRITPHIGVTNNTNAKMWRVLHRMYEIYDRLPTRLNRDGFRFILREKDAIWFDVVFRQDEGEKRVEFYASTSELWAKKFREVIENRMKVTVEEVGRERLQVPADANLYEIRLARHDIFALDVNATEQTSPIGSIMTALDDISMDGDFARLSVCAETYDRLKWAKNASWAHEKLTKGKVPQRAKITPQRALNGLKHALVTVLNEIYDIINDTLNAITNTFFKSDKPLERKQAIEQPNSLIDEIRSTKLSNRSLAKVNQPTWRTHIRIATRASDKLRADLIANTIGSAFGEISGDNELNTIKIRFRARKDEIRRELNDMHLSARTRADGDANLLSCDELAKVALQMPTASVQQRFETALSVNRKVVAEIPNVFQRKGLHIGHAERKSENLPIYIPTDNPNEFFRGYVFQGEMGVGKDTAIQNFVVESVLNHGTSFVIIDQVDKEGRAGMANGIRDSLPADKIIDLNFGDPDYLPPLDLTEVMRKLGRRGADRFANELIDFFDVADMAQTKALLRVAAKASGGSLLETKRIVESDEYRLEKAEQIERDMPLVAHELRALGDKLAKNKVDPILSRLDDFFGDSTLNCIFSQSPHPDLDFERFMREGKVVIVRVPDRVLSTVTVRTLVHWLTLKTLMTRLLMDNNSQSNGTFIIYNEPQTYLNDGLSRLIARIATQGRKERLGCLIAVQYFEQLGKLTKDLVGGGVNWFLFRNGERTIYEALRHRLEPHVTIEEALATEKYHALCLLNFGGRPQEPFLVRMLPPSYERYEAQDNSFLTKRHARQFGRHWADVEREILAAGQTSL